MQTVLKLNESFEDVLLEHDISLKRNKVRILQVNIGNLCNQTCVHCHVNAGPDGRQNMDRRTIDRLLILLTRNSKIHTIDITGGAPELNPNFRYFVSGLTALNKKVIDRCNLTVLLEPGQEETAGFLVANRVQITASLPCYLEENVNQQRGDSAFKKSIAALQILNHLGYGMKESGLGLNLVYNPMGAALPPDQATLESDYKKHLKSAYDIEFNNLFTIANMPIKRFAKLLQREGKLEMYRQMLMDNFNPKAANNVMCREMLSVGWDGRLYDCDFNLALKFPLQHRNNSIWKIEDFNFVNTEIAFGDHCFGCTAGTGSSCGGALI